jgi:uncharacterized protein DUF6159
MAAAPEPPQHESRTRRARRLGRASLQVLRSDRRLFTFPLVAALVNVVVGAGSFLLAGEIVPARGHTRTLILVAGIVASYPATFVGIFCGVALAAMLHRKLDGEPVQVADGWRCARSRVGAILGWTLLVCTVGAVLRVVEQYVPLGGRIAALLLDLSWSLATLFAVPVIAYEGLGPLATLRRSAHLFKERWGEQTAGVVTVGAVSGFLVVPAVVLIGAGAGAGGAGGVVLIAAGGAWILAVQAYAISLNQVYRVFLYRSTLHVGAGGGPFTRADLENPFQPRKNRRWFGRGRA